MAHKTASLLSTAVGTGVGAIGGAIAGGKDNRLGGALLGAGVGAGSGFAAPRMYRSLVSKAPKTLKTPKVQPPSQFVDKAGKTWTPGEMSSLGSLSNGQQFSTKAEFSKWMKKQMALSHPDRVADGGERFRQLSQLRSVVEGGGGSHLNLGKLAHAIHNAVMEKIAAGPPPSIPTPMFPVGLQKVAPTSVSAPKVTMGGGLSAKPYTQVHTQPPAANTAPYSNVKSVSPPSLK
jgi:hypothetical protein